jgi:gamma-glutamyltranspeptidase/glutathione hydrolase
MVATSQRLATQAGVGILKAGGNAADAAVAAAAVLALTEPTSTGLGGDMFALHYEGKTRGLSALNGSGRAPAGLTLGLLKKQGIDALPPDHAHTVTVPGACAGWCDLVERHGTLPLSKLLAPAIRLAEEGFPVGAFTAHSWQAGTGVLEHSPGGRELLLDGRAPRAGETFRNPALARTLKAIGAGGKDAYYKGEIGRSVAATVQKAGGVMTVRDLELHASTWEVPISTSYRGVRVWECPPNGQGLAVLLALNILEGFELRGQDPLGAERWHLLIEAMRLAFADTRWYVADPKFSAVPVRELLAKEYGAKRRARIDPGKASAEVKRGSPVSGSDTVYFSVVDAEGNACSFINSNYMGFGTGLVPEGWGFPLHNRGHLFSLDPAHPNALAPGKRPYHTIIPGMITREDGSLWGPFGVMGGFMQPQGHVQVVVGLIDDGRTPQEAVDRPRFLIEPSSPVSSVQLETGLPPATVEKLRRMGHAVSPEVAGFSRAIFGRGQVIRRNPSGNLVGGSDRRADGCALGT